MEYSRFRVLMQIQLMQIECKLIQQIIRDTNRIGNRTCLHSFHGSLRVTLLISRQFSAIGIQLSTRYSHTTLVMPQWTFSFMKIKLLVQPIAQISLLLCRK
ncbi:hypothetical protein FGO68_gene1871 [Halteria grandinella]|uniref:Uncharacterized protein n=1 Tax=Halteria grandinella TaxID=5974 RepID=A0A8J8TA26_HALGN|nr:hypothetical protein FGO68_gene1871 [Halteria grandinella]